MVPFLLLNTFVKISKHITKDLYKHLKNIYNHYIKSLVVFTKEIIFD